jgi:hypothetical protein
MPVSATIKAGKPLALAIPKQSGRAESETKKPKSGSELGRESIKRQCLLKKIPSFFAGKV